MKQSHKPEIIKDLESAILGVQKTQQIIMDMENDKALVITCEGFGSKYCQEQGQHSWFNHSQDTFHDPKYYGVSNLPEGFVEDAN